MKWFTDTHCHLNVAAFNDDRDEVISGAIQSGVRRFLNPGIDLESSGAAIKLSEAYQEVFAAVGLHPNSADEWNTSTLQSLREIAQHPKVVAIGEIGLDYYWNASPRDIQEQVFTSQLALAAELNLPIVVHNRDATDDVLKILLHWAGHLKQKNHPLARRPGVLHSFSGDVVAARAAIEAGFWLGVTGPVTFKKSDVLHQVVREVGLEWLLVETDSPYLAPDPYRGKRNDPSRVRWIVEKIGQLKDLPAEQVAKKTAANAARLFEW